MQAKEGKLALKEGEAYEDKSPRLSMNIALQGRYIIYMPFQDEQRISRRIRDKKNPQANDNHVGVDGGL